MIKLTNEERAAVAKALDESNGMLASGEHVDGVKVTLRGYDIWVHYSERTDAAKELAIKIGNHALSLIADMPGEDDEWDAVEKYHNCRNIAREALGRPTDA